MRVKLAALAVLCVAAAVPLGGRASSAATLSDWDPGIPALPAASCADGYQALLPTGAHYLPGGGYYYEFDVAGATLKSIIPPASFQALTATDADLATYGFPHRPAASDASLPSWEQTVGAFSGAIPASCYSTTNLVSHPLRAAATPTSGAVYNSGNWSGIVQTAGGGINQVVAGWKVNHLSACSPGCPSGQATAEVGWVGLGGYNSNSPGLVQDGSLIDNGGVPQIWDEWVTANGGGVSIQPHGNVQADDNIQAATTWNGSGANFYVVDTSRSGQASINEVDNLTADYYSGNTAEWIFERPSYCQGGCYRTLSNFGSEGFFGGTWSRNQGSSTTQIQSTGIVALNMASSGSGSATCSSASTLAYDASVSGGSTNVQWCRGS